MKKLAVPQIKLHSLFSEYGANFPPLSADWKMAKHHICLKHDFCWKIFQISLENIKISKDETWRWPIGLNDPYRSLQSWDTLYRDGSTHQCVSFFLDTLSFSFFELFCSRVQMLDTFPAPTQHIKKMGPGLENLASLPNCSTNSCHTIFQSIPLQPTNTHKNERTQVLHFIPQSMFHL